jgi:hypothetical protein
MPTASTRSAHRLMRYRRALRRQSKATSRAIVLCGSHRAPPSLLRRSGAVQRLQQQCRAVTGCRTAENVRHAVVCEHRWPDRPDAFGMGVSMRLRLSAILLALAMTLQVQARAEDLTRADTVYRHCQARGMTYESGVCLGMIVSLGYVAPLLPREVRSCPPTGATNGQMLRVVTQYIRARPSEQHKDFKELALSALRAAWPCVGPVPVTTR